MFVYLQRYTKRKGGGHFFPPDNALSLVHKQENNRFYTSKPQATFCQK